MKITHQRRIAKPSTEVPYLPYHSSWRHTFKKCPSCNIKHWYDVTCQLTWCQLVGNHMLSTMEGYLFPNTFCCNKLSRPVFSSYLFDVDNNDNILIKFHIAILPVALTSCLLACILVRTLKTKSVLPSLLNYAVHLSVATIVPAIMK